MKKLIYKGPIREGVFGTLTKEDYSIYFDEHLQYAYLDPKPVVNYEDSSYRIAVNESNEIARYYELHSEIQTAYFNLIKNYLNADSVVLEIGCGGGIILDKSKSKCKKTIGIEPNREYQKALRQNGHLIYSDMQKSLEEWEGKIDLVISFHVIEHVHDPNEFFDSIHKLLRKGGKAFVLTPNYDDILLKINFNDFAPFFFRKAHTLYLTIKGMRKIIEASGMDYLQPVYVHEYGLANALYWLRDKKPMGHLAMEGIDKDADEIWQGYLKKTGQTKDIAILFQKN